MYLKIHCSTIPKIHFRQETVIIGEMNFFSQKKKMEKEKTQLKVFCVVDYYVILHHY